MHETGFTKLFSTIVTSTIWREDDKTRILWITMLATANKYGEVAGSVPGLAAMANMSVEDCRKAILKLESPDPDSRTSDNEGKRIVKVDGGWEILNYTLYREKMRVRDSQYFRDYRAAKKVQSATICNQSQPPAASRTIAQPRAEADAEAKAFKNNIPQNFDKFWSLYPKKLCKKNTLQQWIKLNPNEDLAMKIFLSVVTYKQTEQWQKDGGKYIPYPERFLKHKRWEDEIETITKEKMTPSQLAFEQILEEERNGNGQGTGTASI
jgi:hypothetical protein